MTIKTSTGLRNHALATGSIKSALDGLVLKLYGGAVPPAGSQRPAGQLARPLKAATGAAID